MRRQHVPAEISTSKQINCSAQHATPNHDDRRCSDWFSHPTIAKLMYAELVDMYSSWGVH